MKLAARFYLISVMLVFFVSSLLAGVLDPKLQQKMASGAGPFSVIITFKSQSDVLSLSSLGVRFEALSSLPMTGAKLTTVQINTVLQWESVESIYSNEPIKYHNFTAGQITGGHYVHDVLGYKGAGVTVFVLDTGVDGLHPDLPFRSKVIENVRAVTTEGLVGGFAAYLEGVPNSDNYGGHGTHVAGTVAGTGEASLGDERRARYYAGIAPAAKLVGYGMMGADAAATSALLDALKGFNYAIANRERFHINVITNSWGSSTTGFDPLNPINRASFEAYRNGIVVAFAAGNHSEGDGENTMTPTSSVPWVISVAAGDANKELATFSNRGVAGDPFLHPDITAPGVGVRSTRARGTPTGSLGNFVDINHPTYTVYYHALSGTSMATPFTAGAVALLLNANPQLSPDQIEDILTSTADPMPSYPFHHVGYGYINVQKAVGTALITPGKRNEFIAGDTKWASQGNWTEIEQTDSRIEFNGDWLEVTDAGASGGSYRTVHITGGKKAFALFSFHGKGIKFHFPKNDAGGTAEVIIDGVNRGIISYHNASQIWNSVAAFAGMERTNHLVQLKGITGNIYLDKVLVDGSPFANNIQLSEDTTSFTGLIGPSATGVPETRLIPFEVSSNTFLISATLSYQPAGDMDFYLIDPNGNQIGQGASLSNPEELSAFPTVPGVYNYQIVGYATVAANYTLASTLTKATEPSTGKSPIADPGVLQQTPTKYALEQNYPNPFNPVTSIKYKLATEGMTRLLVYNILGQQVASPVNEWQAAGSYSVRFDATGLGSGIYFYTLASGGFSETKRMVIVK